MRSQDAVSAMLCPVCRTGLSMTDRAGVEIDYCPTCRGVWLDRGELDKIIDRAEGSTARSTRRAESSDRRESPGGLMGMAASMIQGDHDRYDRHRDDRYSSRDKDRYPKKKKSILSEFFD